LVWIREQGTLTVVFLFNRAKFELVVVGFDCFLLFCNFQALPSDSVLSADRLLLGDNWFDNFNQSGEGQGKY
jgi:hypothetical protein